MDENTPKIDLQENLPKNLPGEFHDNHNKTKIVITIVILLAVVVFGYFFFKNKDIKKYEEHTVTNEERLKMLERLDVTPEDQKKNELSTEEKNKFADSISDAGVYKKGEVKSKEELDKILNATN